MIELRAGEAVATVDPGAGGSLTALRVGGVDLLTDDGCFVMAPWAGRTGHGRFTFDGVEHRLPVPADHAPHAIHGTVRSRRWSIDTATADRVVLSVDLGPDWPWRGRCQQAVGLTGDAITLELSVHTDGEPFPAILGWHPWFTKPVHVDLEADALLERGDDRLPTGRRSTGEIDFTDRPLDDCFEGVRWPVVLRWAELTLAIEAVGCRYVVQYDQPVHATCVEPQTGPPNGLVTGEHAIVAPGEPLVASTTWRWS